MEVGDKFHLPYSRIKNNWEIIDIGKKRVIVRDNQGYTRTVTVEDMEFLINKKKNEKTRRIKKTG